MKDDTATDFTTDPAGLPVCHPTEVVELGDGDVYDITIAPVANRVGDATVRMLAYAGSIPGPTLRVRQGSEARVRVRNEGDHETTVHWHGLRLANEFDGVPGETQAPIPVGGEFTYRLRFPDDGLYWYHPHVREDYGLEMGLYGNIVVDAAERASWGPVDREAIVTLDDVLIEAGRIATFRRTGPTHTAMGRFGNVMLAAGVTDLRLEARAGEVVRFFLTNTANTRIFNVAVPGARMKLVGGDSGRYEREEWVDAVLLAPSERAVVDVLFATSGDYALEHRAPDHTYVLGVVSVAEERPKVSYLSEFESLHVNDELAAERVRLTAQLERAPDKTLVLDARMPLLYGEAAETASAAAAAWTCPMHAEIVREQPGVCPKCGMKLIPAAPAAHERAHHGGGEGHDTDDGLEWEDLMPDINARTDATNMVWKLVDADSGHENEAIDWTFRVGDRAKIRLVNTMESDHPMHHPFHIHGAGRFLVLSRGGVHEPNLVWKDTVLVRAGETVDILFDVTNPGLWMAHCHIAEHNQVGMMFSFRVR
jgi:FtsP/CotA-like multicopper oxidase with cupredoxin domain